MNDPDLVIAANDYVSQSVLEQRFRDVLGSGLARRLRWDGFQRVDLGGSSGRRWSIFAVMGDGTAVPVRLRVEDFTARDPDNKLGMSDDFIDHCIDVAYKKVMAKAEEMRAPKQAPDPVRRGVVGFDGFAGLELGDELKHALGDEAYVLDAEMRGDKVPDRKAVTSLNPASSTP